MNMLCCLITARDSMFSIAQNVQKYVAPIACKNETMKWIWLKIWQHAIENGVFENSSVISWKLLKIIDYLVLW